MHVGLTVLLFHLLADYFDISTSLNGVLLFLLPIFLFLALLIDFPQGNIIFFVFSSFLLSHSCIIFIPYFSSRFMSCFNWISIQPYDNLNVIQSWAV